MPKVVFTTPAGARQAVDGRDGDSIMETAVKHGVPGIIGECGGSAACGTCHVYVDEAFVADLDVMDGLEDDMLEGVIAERLPNSRLSCQLRLSGALDGIAVTVAPRQR